MLMFWPGVSAPHISILEFLNFPTLTSFQHIIKPNSQQYFKISHFNIISKIFCLTSAEGEHVIKTGHMIQFIEMSNSWNNGVLGSCSERLLRSPA